VSYLSQLKAFLRSVISAALWAHSKVDAHLVSEKKQGDSCHALLSRRRDTVMKFVIVAGATLALVATASAADLPRPQPVYQQPSVGKMPIGKSPIGKAPLGKTPVTARY
jgi:hypothetical protein